MVARPRSANSSWKLGLYSCFKKTRWYLLLNVSFIGKIVTMLLKFLLFPEGRKFPSYWRMLSWKLAVSSMVISSLVVYFETEGSVLHHCLIISVKLFLRDFRLLE